MTPANPTWRKSQILIKEALGLPIYLAGTVAFMKATRGDSTVLLIVGLLTVATAYNAFFEFLFPDHALRWQWNKVGALLAGQALAGAVILIVAWHLGR